MLLGERIHVIGFLTAVFATVSHARRVCQRGTPYLGGCPVPSLFCSEHSFHNGKGAWHATRLKTRAGFQHPIHPDLRPLAAGRSGRGGVGERRAKREEGESSKSAGRSISSWDADEMD
ncbi:unnamed protein product, partial [Ectocarpus sp. 12 AP-2014]